MTKFETFEQLLARGQENFIDPDNNITGIEPSTLNGKFKEQLASLNRYIYTTYSTNAGDKVLSIEGVIPLNTFKRIEPLLLQQGYWYIAANPLTYTVAGSNIPSSDEFDADLSHYLILNCVNNNEINQYRSWKVLCSVGGKTYLYNDKIQTHFIQPRSDTDYDYREYISDETLEYTDELLYKGDNPLISIMIQDPIVGRISLYSNLLKFLS